MFSNVEKSGNLFMYFTQGVAATEVEVDTLTGDHTVLRVDIHVRTSILLHLRDVNKPLITDGRREIFESCYRLRPDASLYLSTRVHIC